MQVPKQDQNLQLSAHHCSGGGLGPCWPTWSPLATWDCSTFVKMKNPVPQSHLPHFTSSVAHVCVAVELDGVDLEHSVMQDSPPRWEFPHGLHLLSLDCGPLLGQGSVRMLFPRSLHPPCPRSREEERWELSSLCSLSPTATP